LRVFPLLCPSRHLVASLDTPIVALIGGVLLSLAAADDPRYVQLAVALALVCAMIVVLFWRFRLSFLANFLSRAIQIGVIGGLGVAVFTSQLKTIMGVLIDAEGYLRGSSRSSPPSRRPISPAWPSGSARSPSSAGTSAPPGACPAR
jgi:MFS superfamily sulfate permease-like transporter